MEDDFWNSSSRSGFSFDDEDLDTSASSSDLFRTTPEVSSELPIYAIISKKCLDILLDDARPALHPPVMSVEEAIRKMVSGHIHSLTGFVRFADKMTLLDKALETCDANVIIQVVLYLYRTLKSNIFYHQLVKRKVAVKHYAYYLFVRNHLEEAADLYMATGNSANMKYLYYLTGQGLTNKSILYKKLEQFVIEHTSENCVDVQDHLTFLKFQTEHQFSSESVIGQLAELFKLNLTNHKGLEQAVEFKKTYRIDDFAYDWTLLNVLASMKLWLHINDIFLKNNWLTKKSSLKTPIPADVFVIGLSRHQPPKDVLEGLLSYISDSDKAFEIANKLQCHTYIIQTYLNQRDRVSLLMYKEKVQPQSAEYCLIESALQSSKQWKN